MAAAGARAARTPPPIRPRALLGLCLVFLLSQPNTPLTRAFFQGGESSKRANSLQGRYPYMAQLLHPDALNGTSSVASHLCAGVLIDHSSILTAAHCLEEKHNGHPGPAVRIGDDSNFVIRETAVANKLPEWTGNISQGFDLAVITLSVPVYGVKPVEVLDQPSTSELSGLRVWLTAWNVPEEEEDQSGAEASLQQLELTHVNRSMCSAEYEASAYDSMQITPEMICAGGEAGQRICKTDSGGPLIWPRSGSSGDLVVGILSFVEHGCTDSGPPGIFTRLGAFRTDLEFFASPVALKPPPPPFAPPAPPVPPLTGPTYCSYKPCAESSQTEDAAPMPFCSTSKQHCEGFCKGYLCPVEPTSVPVESYCSARPCAEGEQHAIQIPFCSASQQTCEISCGGSFCSKLKVQPGPQTSSYCRSTPCSDILEDTISNPFCSKTQATCEISCGGHYCPQPEPEPKEQTQPSYCRITPCSDILEDSISNPFCSKTQAICEISCGAYYCPRPEEEPVPSYCRRSPCSDILEDSISNPFCSKTQATCEISCGGHYCPQPEKQPEPKEEAQPSYCRRTPCSDTLEDRIYVPFCAKTQATCEISCGGHYCPEPQPEPQPSYCRSTPCSSTLEDKISVAFCSESKSNCEVPCGGYFCLEPQPEPEQEEEPSYCRSTPCSGMMEDRILVPFCSESRINCETSCEGHFCPLPKPKEVLSYCRSTPCSNTVEDRIVIEFCLKTRSTCESFCGGHYCPLPEQEPRPEEELSYCRSTPCSDTLEDSISLPFCSESRTNCETPCGGFFCPQLKPRAPAIQAATFCLPPGLWKCSDGEAYSLKAPSCTESKESCEGLCGGLYCVNSPPSPTQPPAPPAPPPLLPVGAPYCSGKPCKNGPAFAWFSAHCTSSRNACKNSCKGHYCVVQPPPLTDYKALMQLKIQQKTVWKLETWGLSSNVCDWKGVECCSGTVCKLDLTSNDLIGTLPPVWSTLTGLQHLALQDNRFTGSLPARWSTLKGLKEISLYWNKLSGPLPKSWSSITSLQVIDLESNALRKGLPKEWSKMRALRKIYLCENKLTGSLPSHWSSLSLLKLMNLQKNSLTGPLPKSWSTLSSLEHLNLQDNKLRTWLPPAWSTVEAALSNPPKSKKGASFATGTYPWAAMKRVAALRPSWFYNWSPSPPNIAPPEIEFVPMIWAARNTESTREKLEAIKVLHQEGKITAMLGFNEPDNDAQADMSVAKALEAWSELELDGLLLGSPATIEPHDIWMKDFVSGVNQAGYRMDFIAMHWYGSPNVATFIERLHSVHKEYGLPIWITEFAPADWYAEEVESNKMSADQVQLFMRKVLPQLDKLDFVHRYCWFGFRPDHTAGHPSALFDESNKKLTALGQIYANHAPHELNPAVS